jgi:ABC-2 type transport system ATP-binding protein
MVTEPVLEVAKLIKDYDEYRAVNNVTFTIGRGQVMGLLGPNGAGKSTTIQILLGITTRTSGGIRYFGQDFDRRRQASLARINFASAYNTLQGRLTVKQNMQVFAGLYGLRKSRAKIAELLEYFEIGRLANHNYRYLSAGERTRVNLAKALLNDPELILMDEPTASLDPDIADKTLSLIEQLRRDRAISILFTSHNMGEVARICDEVIFLDKGKIVSQDTPSNHTGRISKTQVVIGYRGPRAKLEACLVKPPTTYEHSGEHTITVQTTSDGIAPLIERLSRAGVRIVDIDIQKATLEDVFLEIARREKS